MHVVMDKGGRIVIPRDVRARWRLTPGTELELTESEHGLELLVPDTRPVATVVQEGGVLTFDAPVGAERLDDTLAQRDATRDRPA